MALWKAARAKSLGWFIALLLINTQEPISKYIQPGVVSSFVKALGVAR